MELWDAVLNDKDAFSLLRFGYEENGHRAKWGPGARNYYIIHYILSGKGYFNGNPLKPGFGFLIRPMQQVEYHMDSADPWQYFWISFSGKTAEQICKNHISTGENGIFSWSHIPLIRELLRQLNSRDHAIAPMFALSLLYQILAAHEEEPKQTQKPHVERAVKLISKHISQPLSVGQIATACNLDDRYLYNLFIKHMGISPKQYISQARLSHAKALLRESNYSVAEVAASVGYDDALAFSKFFARHVGLSPTCYRKEHKL
jgi:AraC-like DNA-binding protein